MEEFVYPNEGKMVEHEGLPAELESDLQQRVKALGLWAPNLPREWGGMGIGYIGQAPINEIIGRSVVAPRLFGNAAPDVQSLSHYVPRNVCTLQGRGCDSANLFSLRAGQTRDEHFRNFDGQVRALTAEALELAKQSGI